MTQGENLTKFSLIEERPVGERIVITQAKSLVVITQAKSRKRTFMW